MSLGRILSSWRCDHWKKVRWPIVRLSGHFLQWANASQQLNVCSTVLCMELTCVIRSDVEIYITPWDWEGNIILIYNILKCFIKCKEFCDFFKVHFSNFKIFAFNNIEIITIYHHFKTSEKHFARCMNCEKISFSLF